MADDIEHSRTCPVHWGADIPCDCYGYQQELSRLRADVEALKRVASAARSLMSEDGAREEMACYNVLFILDDALRALPEHLK